MGRPVRELLADRSVASGSVYSTILIATAIERAAPTRRIELLADIGCGDSPYRSLIAHDRYIGVDWRPTGRGADLVVGDVSRLPLVDGVADGVLCTEVIEHVPDERILAAELARIAAPGACLMLSAPFVHGLHEQPHDFRRLTSVGLVTTLEAAGWHVDTFRPIGGSFVVTLDGAVRLLDSAWRRACRKIVGRQSQSFRVLAAPSAALQVGLAKLTLLRGRSFGETDPMSPSPRLTLGYVVAATLSNGGDPHCGASAHVPAGFRPPIPE